MAGPILLGSEHWGTFEIDNVHKGILWKTWVLLCGWRSKSECGCADKMRCYIERGGRGGGGPMMETTEGGRISKIEFIKRVFA